MKARPGELKAGWNRRERDIGFAWGGSGASRNDGHLLFGALCMEPMPQQNSLAKELEKRGYDLTTLKFSIRQKRALHVTQQQVAGRK